MLPTKFTLLAIAAFSGIHAFSQIRTESAILRSAGELHAVKQRVAYEKLKTLAVEKRWALSIQDKNGGIAILQGTDAYGNPVYLITDNNSDAAATISTNKLYSGGSLGLSLSGSSSSMLNKVALWDGGNVLTTHQDLTGRITNKDLASVILHSTHVAGTMMGSGAGNPLARGMAYGLPKLITHDFDDHISEMMSEAPNLLISNHSYGEIGGWFVNQNEGNRWEFWGPYNRNEDPRFGFYSSDTQVWDSIAYNAPYYLIVKSSGNNRSLKGPAVGQPYWRYNSSGVMADAGNRPAGISSNDGYDIITTYGTAKNILTVGAVYPLTAGYTGASSVTIAPFSSWGPTDDGRIKPDIVADGVGLLSTSNAGNTLYASLNGTSMSTPNISGSLALLQEYYAQKHGGAFMRSATLRGLIIHTADEAGPAAGPDYQFGWGLANIAKAATTITDDFESAKKQIIQEKVLNNGTTYTIGVTARDGEPLTATICWTDPKGSVTPNGTLNDPTPKLVHDLDLRVSLASDGTMYYPWKLDRTNPSAAATKGDNIVDNVEKIEIPNPVAGKTYVITVSHKTSLARGSQAFSLIVSGVASVVTGIQNVDATNIALTVSPNPSKGKFVTEFTVTKKADLHISVLNSIGQKAYEASYPGFVGHFNKTIEVPQLAPGMYMLRILHDNKSYLKKLVIR
ncbi:S8 family serine peptidase [Pseudoflavitalea sp. G-6-1-2]|uniref:S8 family serine peptidase n=1 Tax=Pseudoflavitalea sp. G-6-1-2 TaxID=2728841 RepID=UPI00146A7CF9|nr:S8 family serine peptidase [Pseudoflavitalea sp. G-6-1-2]NML20171.1 S8 family serine peptidase [Pseudoflavitalea sp. G-6-1-2]